MQELPRLVGVGSLRGRGERRGREGPPADDFSPPWAAEVQTDNSPPANPDDFVDFMNRLVDRYQTDSAIGRVHAVQIWNEPNLTRDWGEKPITQQAAREYAYLLKETYKSVKQVDPNIAVVTAGNSPPRQRTVRPRPMMSILIGCSRLASRVLRCAGRSRRGLRQPARDPRS